jgi:cellulose biosynthesis protein BcsQ
MMLYTWKDIERELLLNKSKWQGVISDSEIYTDEVIIRIKKGQTETSAKKILLQIFGKKYDDKKIFLDLPGECLDVSFEIDEDEKNDSVATPLFRNVLYQKTAYYSELIEKELPGVPVLAFHSYKGGVGRTLSLLAFIKAWSELNNLENTQKLLIVDADIEAPGITWLTMKQEEASFSFLDLLEVTQEKDNVNEIIELIADKVLESIVKIETERGRVEHIVLPTYRYVEQLLDMYASPESLAISYNKKYILAEVLSKLGEKVNAGLVLIDLRAGLSEFSAPLLFDPRVKKYLVTSTSYQSVKGTGILLQQLSKGLPLNENSKIPEVLLTMVQNGMNTDEIISELIAVYHPNIVEGDDSIMDDIVTELPFASELVHLETLPKIMSNLSGRDFYKNISEIVKNSYMVSGETKGDNLKVSRNKVINNIHEFAANQITAEGNGTFEVLMTESIQNLIRKYKNSIPNTVIMGAKGSGKTFLYREILRDQYWEKFVERMSKNDPVLKGLSGDKCILAVPLLASGNAGGFPDVIKNAITGYNQCGTKGKISNSVYVDSKDMLLTYVREYHDILEWKEIWKKVILNAFDTIYPSLVELEEELQYKHIKLVFLLDGLEEIFEHTISSENEKNAIRALCRDLLDEVKIAYQNMGLMIFLRKDMARDSLTINYEQFYSLYRAVELQWSNTEALRLAAWLTSQAVPDFYQENIPIEMAPGEVIEQTLNRLWGVKLGKPTSNEAYSSRWILAALSDFNGQLQARDIIRFLEKATEHVGKAVYEDRYLMPIEIRKAVSDCSNDKIGEIRDEIKALGPIFDKLEHASEEKKVLPFSTDTFSLSQAEEKIMKQEGYLKIDNDRYYLPEIIRHALKFKYEKGARPKVLSLLLK